MPAMECIGDQGKKAVVKHLVDLLDKGCYWIRGHSPMIEITSDTTATGKWDLHVSLRNLVPLHYEVLKVGVLTKTNMSKKTANGK